MYENKCKFMGLSQMLYAAYVPQPKEIVCQSHADSPISIQTCGDDHVAHKILIDTKPTSFLYKEALNLAIICF